MGLICPAPARAARAARRRIIFQAPGTDIDRVIQRVITRSAVSSAREAGGVLLEQGPPAVSTPESAAPSRLPAVFSGVTPGGLLLRIAVLKIGRPCMRSSPVARISHLT